MYSLLAFIIWGLILSALAIMVFAPFVIALFFFIASIEFSPSRYRE